MKTDNDFQLLLFKTYKNKMNFSFIQLTRYLLIIFTYIYFSVCTPEELAESPSCAGYKAFGLCDISDPVILDFMRQNCNLTCGICERKLNTICFRKKVCYCTYTTLLPTKKLKFEKVLLGYLIFIALVFGLASAFPSKVISLAFASTFAFAEIAETILKRKG